MERNLASIEFETRAEVEEIMGAIGKYVQQNPKEKSNKVLERFYNLLDVMDMEW